MKMNKYDVLEKCLQALENGQTIDAILSRYPDQARELRPLLTTAAQAKTLDRAPLPDQFQKRDRNRLIRQAAEIRESKSSSRRMIPLFPRLALTFGVVGALVLSSTGLVGASANSIPGDQLYPVKRTWEGVKLLFVFTPQGRELLQSQYEQERLNEADELLSKGRGATPITFSGLVTQSQDGSWVVSGIPVSVSNSTILPNTTITDSAPVMVIGVSRSDGTIEAQEIQLLQPGAPLPPFRPTGNGEQESDSNLVSTQTAPMVPTGTPSAQSSGTSQSLGSQNHQHATYEFSGVVESMQTNGVWTINGQLVRVDQAEISGSVQVGSTVNFQGYYDDNGEFIASQLTASGDSSTYHHNNGGNNNGGVNTSPTHGGDDGGDRNGSGGSTPSGGGEGGNSWSGGTPTGGDH